MAKVIKKNISVIFIKQIYKITVVNRLFSLPVFLWHEGTAHTVQYTVQCTTDQRDSVMRKVRHFIIRGAAFGLNNCPRTDFTFLQYSSQKGPLVLCND